MTAKLREVMSQIEAAARIRRTGGFVDTDNLITHPGPGLKVWAAIDCLCNYHHCRYGGSGEKAFKRGSKGKSKRFNRR